MRIWDDNNTPLAYLITFRTYGTWLHGDERTSVDRYHNAYGTARIPHRKARLDYNKSIMKGHPVLLDAERRKATDDAIREVCEHREWRLRALNVRTNHVHIVVSIGPR